MQDSTDIWYVNVHGAAYGPYTGAQMRSYVEEGRINAQSLISKNSANEFVNAMNLQEFAQWSNRVSQAPEPVLRPVTNPTSKGVLARDHYASEPVNTRVSPAPAPMVSPDSLGQPIHQNQSPQIAVPGSLGQPLQPAPQLSRPAKQPDERLQPAPVPQAAQPAPASVQTPQTEPSQKPSVFLIMAEIRSDNGLAFLQNLQQSGVVQRIGDSVWILRGFTTAQMLRNSLSQSLTADDRLFILDSFANEPAWFNIGTEMDRQIRALWDLDASP